MAITAAAIAAANAITAAIADANTAAIITALPYGLVLSPQR